MNNCKVVKVSKSKEYGTLNVQLKGRIGLFRYLGVALRLDGGMEAEWKHREGEGRKFAAALKNVWKRRKVATGQKIGMYN